VPIGYEEKTFVLRIVLELDPIFEGAEVVADVETPGGAHAAQHSFLVVHAWWFSSNPRMGPRGCCSPGLQTRRFPRGGKGMLNGAACASPAEKPRL
jgi:hypothetical protein